jgi:hypothetical protein
MAETNVRHPAVFAVQLGGAQGFGRDQRFAAPLKFRRGHMPHDFGDRRHLISQACARSCLVGLNISRMPCFETQPFAGKFCNRTPHARLSYKTTKWLSLYYGITPWPHDRLTDHLKGYGPVPKVFPQRASATVR